MRTRVQTGCISLDKRIKTWNFFYWENGKRRSKKIGTVTLYPTKASAWRAAKPLRDALENQTTITNNAPNVSTLVEQGRQPLSYTHVWYTLEGAAREAGVGHVSSHTFRHTHRAWLDSVGTPVGVQQKLRRHADIRTTMNIYGDAATADMREAHEKVVRLALARA